jgi:putative endonuclease
MRDGWVYIVSNRPNGTLHVGVTADLPRRIWPHRKGIGSEFVRKYGLQRLVYAERHEEIVCAIQRERNIKDWPRAWKVRLIQRENPKWRDLYDALNCRSRRRSQPRNVMAGGPPVRRRQSSASPTPRRGGGRPATHGLCWAHRDGEPPGLEPPQASRGRRAFVRHDGVGPSPATTRYGGSRPHAHGQLTPTAAHPSAGR